MDITPEINTPKPGISLEKKQQLLSEFPLGKYSKGKPTVVDAAHDFAMGEQRYELSHANKEPKLKRSTDVIVTRNHFFYKTKVGDLEPMVLVDGMMRVTDSDYPDAGLKRKWVSLERRLEGSNNETWIGDSPHERMQFGDGALLYERGLFRDDDMFTAFYRDGRLDNFRFDAIKIKSILSIKNKGQKLVDQGRIRTVVHDNRVLVPGRINRETEDTKHPVYSKHDLEVLLSRMSSDGKSIQFIKVPRDIFDANKRGNFDDEELWQNFMESASFNMSVATEIMPIDELKKELFPDAPYLVDDPKSYDSSADANWRRANWQSMLGISVNRRLPGVTAADLEDSID